MHPVKIGLIGCGSIATTAHVPAIKKLIGTVKLVATADINLQAAINVAKPFNAQAYRDYQDLLAQPDVELVILATPEFLHYDQTLAAARAGKHILCEKPMAPSLKEADGMIEVCEKAGVKLMIGHSRRSTTRYLKTKQLIELGNIGEVRLFRENERRQRPPLGQVGVYWQPNHWTGNPNQSVGVALTNAIHETDLFTWFIESQPSTVFAESRIAREGNLVPDFISITVQYENGAVASAEVNNSTPPSYPGYHQLEIYGTKGQISVKDMDQQALTLYQDEGAQAPQVYNRLLRFDDAYVSQIDQMVQSLRKGKPVAIPPRQARQALQIALAAVTSAKENTIIDLKTYSEAA